MIDIHAHILNNVDDGAIDLDMSIKMLQNAVRGGTTGIVATPHFMRGRFEVEYNDVVQRVEELKKPCKLYKFSTFIKEFPSIIDAAKYLNVTPACIFNSLKRNGYKESGAILRKYFIKV